MTKAGLQSVTLPGSPGRVGHFGDQRSRAGPHDARPYRSLPARVRRREFITLLGLGFQWGKSGFADGRHLRKLPVPFGAGDGQRADISGLHVRKRAADGVHGCRDPAADQILYAVRPPIWHMSELKSDRVGQHYSGEMQRRSRLRTAFEHLAVVGQAADGDELDPASELRHRLQRGCNRVLQTVRGRWRRAFRDVGIA
jgi:hypothetical protein